MVQDALTLKGRTVAITRPRDQAEETGKLIRKYGGKPYVIPAIEISGTGDLSVVEHFVDELSKNKVDYVVFMSVNGIKYLLTSAEKLGLKTRLEETLKKTAIMAVGPKTAQELRNHNIPVDLVPATYSSEGIIECLIQHGVSGKTIYIPRTRGATPELTNKLTALGGNVKEIYVYDSKLPHNQDLEKRFLQDLTDGNIDAIIFGSSLSAKNLFKMLGETVSKQKLKELMNNKLTIVAIGPVTAETLSKMGLTVDVMPDKYLFEAALIKLAQHWNLEQSY